MKLSSHLPDYHPPGGRRPPPEVVRGLREIDPLAELVYVGHGRWLLGKVHPGEWDKREEAIRAMDRWVELVAQLDPRDHEVPLKELLPGLFDRWNEKRLHVMGFQPLPTVWHMELPDSTMVEHFRRVDFIWRNITIEEEEERLRKMDGTADLEERKATIMERFDQIYRSVWKHAFKHPVTRRPGATINPDGSLQRTA